MNPFKSLPIHKILVAALVGVVSFISNPSAIAGGDTPAGDLTVTVEEQENGDVKFTLSGTAFMQGFHPGMNSTNSNSSTPPSPGFSFLSSGLPPGLILTTPDNETESSEDPEEGAPLPPIDHPVNEIYSSSGGWFLGTSSYTGHLYPGDPITGSGSVTTSEINFDQYFVPGTFIVEPGEFEDDSEVEGSEVAEGSIDNVGNYPYYITYEVIPFEYDPSLAIAGPGSFPKTLVGKSAGSQKVTITNSGNTSLTGLGLSITGPGSRDFSVSGLPKKELAPGESTTVEVGFRPRRKGNRSATLTVKGIYTPRQEIMFAPAAEVEETSIEEVSPLPPVEVSASTRLSGKGMPAPKAKPRPNTPRFPRGV